MPLDEYDTLLDDLNQGAWKILTGTSAKAVSVLTNSNEALKFVGYDMVGLGSLIRSVQSTHFER